MRSHCYTATPEQAAEISAAHRDLCAFAEEVGSVVRACRGGAHVTAWVEPRGMEVHRIVGYISIRAGGWSISARASREGSEGRNAAAIVRDVREQFWSRLVASAVHHEEMARVFRAALEAIR